MNRPPEPNTAVVRRFGGIALNYSPDIADRPISDTGELAVLLGGSPSSFTGVLLALMQKADHGNRRRLAYGFPYHDVALEIWSEMEAPTYGNMADVLTSLTELWRIQRWQSKSGT